MKPRELTVQDVALFSRLIVEKADYEGLSEEEKQNCTLALTAAKAFAAGYAGLDMDTVDLDDVAYAVLVIAAEMVDNHQMTNSKPARTLYFKGLGGFFTSLVGLFSLMFSLYRFRTSFMNPSMRAALSCFMRSVKCPYRSSVKAAEAWPRLPWMVLTSSPARMELTA